MKVFFWVFKRSYFILGFKIIFSNWVTGLFAGQYNTKLHGTITDVIYTQHTQQIKLLIYLKNKPISGHIDSVKLTSLIYF